MHKHSFSMTALGVISGVVVNYTFALHGEGFDIVGFFREISVGLIFGLAIAAYFRLTGLADWGRAVGIVLVSAVCWMIALKAAIAIHDSLNSHAAGSANATDSYWNYLGAGIPAGAVGSSLMVLSLFLLLGLFRGWRLRVGTVICGALIGALLAAVDALESGLVLFPVWQGAFAYCLSLALSERQRAGTRPTLA